MTATSYTPALVHDYLLVMRGAERTFAAMADCWPEASVRTLLYDQRGTRGSSRTGASRSRGSSGSAYGSGAVSASCCRCSRCRPSGCRSTITRPSCPAAARSRTACGPRRARPRLLLPLAIPLRVARARERWPSCPPRLRAALGAVLDAIRALGRQGARARHPLRGELGDHAPADRRVLRPRRGRRASAGRGRPILASASPRTGC